MINELFNVSDYDMLSKFLSQRDQELQASINEDAQIIQSGLGECKKVTGDALSLLVHERKQYE